MTQLTIISVGSLKEGCGGDARHTWVARTASDKDKLQFFRHAVPESVNMLIDQRKKMSDVKPESADALDDFLGGE